MAGGCPTMELPVQQYWAQGRKCGNSLPARPTDLLSKFLFICFVVVGLELRAYTLSLSTSPFL
jgi:hypothetical protein